jgi:GrpB-like predicted nucleotidyltransferase (UPF0157 family)
VSATPPRTSIGELARHDCEDRDVRVVLCDYDERWPSWFHDEAARIRVALGARALLVEHVGSTAVPGLLAKPRIDILLGVADPADEPAYVPALEAAGYWLRIREPEWHEHRLFKSRRRDLNLHVFAAGSSEIERMLRFRDTLRADAAARERYVAVKRELSLRDWPSVNDYANAKSGVVESILAGAV